MPTERGGAGTEPLEGSSTSSSGSSDATNLQRRQLGERLFPRVQALQPVSKYTIAPLNKVQYLVIYM